MCKFWKNYQHANVVFGEGVFAEVLSCGGVQSGAVVVADVVVDRDRPHFHLVFCTLFMVPFLYPFWIFIL